MTATPRGAGRVAVVTGAAGGIGRATAERLLQDGGRVVAVDLDADALRWVDAHEHAVAVTADIGAPAGNREMVEVAVARFGGLDTLVLNAAVAQVGPFESVGVDELDRVLRVNLRGVVLGLQAALPALERSAAPAVVAVASISGMRGEPYMAVYAASKGGVINLVRAAAVEFGARGVRVNCVCPGPTETPMTLPGLHAAPAVAARLRRSVPLKRLAAPAEIGEVIAFVASPAASFLTGAVIPVDGGVTANVGQVTPPAAVEAVAA